MAGIAGRRVKGETLKIAWLFVLALLGPMLFFGFRWWQVNKTPPVIWTGGVESDAAGEQSVLWALSYQLEKQIPTNRIIIGYWTPEENGKYLSQVKKGTRPYVKWDYTVEYNRSHKTLVKRLYLRGRIEASELGHIWVWENVEESAIHQIAAPVRALKNFKQIQAYKGCNFSALKKYGARLREETPRE